MTERICSWEKCSNSIEHKAKQARYCSVSCTDKARYARSGDVDRARMAKYYAANSDKIKAKTKEWRELHPDLVAAYKRNHVARQFDAPGDGVSALDWMAVMDWAHYTCIYCRVALGVAESAVTMEHVVPLNRGGAHDVSNVGPACKSCNSSKQDRLPAEWLPKWVAPWWIEYPVV